MRIELIEDELQIYNSKIRLLSWLFEEIKLQDPKLKDELNKKGQELPINC